MSQNKYQEEFDKYKNVPIDIGLYHLKNAEHVKYKILEIFPDKNQVKIETIRSGNIQTKTLHWCRKNLVADNSNDEPTDSLV